MEGRDDSLTRRSMDTDADAPPPAYELLASQAAEECGDVTSEVFFFKKKFQWRLTYLR